MFLGKIMVSHSAKSKVDNQCRSVMFTTLLLSSSVFHALFGFDSGNIINKQSGIVMIRYLTRYYYSPTSILNDVTWTILNSKSNFSSFYGRKFQTLRNHSKKIGYGIS